MKSHSSNSRQTSKFLSLLLRHKPETIGLTLDAEGWADVDDLLEKIRASGRPPLSRGALEKIVAENDKKRFAFDESGARIRASQGHSLKSVNLNLPPVKPPETLYHGTTARFAESIRKKGLLPGGRLHVHLSSEKKTARAVGGRRGKPLVLRILAGRLHAAGHPFYLSANGVWLTNAFSPEYIEWPPE